MSAFANILIGGVFHAAVLFLVAAGLQLVFGVQKIVNLACGSFYALGAYFGVTFIAYANQLGLSPWLIFPGLLIAGGVLGVIGPPIERVLRTVYGRDEGFQLLLTFALVLMFQDVFRFFWGANPRSPDNAYQIYGIVNAGDLVVPVYNLMVVATAIAVAVSLGAILGRTNFGRIEPSPPITTTAKASTMNSIAMSSEAAAVGTIRAPAVVPSAAPSVNTIE